MSAVDALLEIFQLDEIAPDRYRGREHDVTRRRTFGGQVVAQTLAAAYRTVSDDRTCHSLHAYFLRGGDPPTPIEFEVDRVRDGRSFTTRRINAIQHGEVILTMIASFHVMETGYVHQADMPDVPGPEACPSIKDLQTDGLPKATQAVLRYFARPRPVELRPTSLTHFTTNEKLPAKQLSWIRTTSPIPEDVRLGHCVLAYFSDMTLIDTALFPHGITIYDETIQGASLDHSVWFHAPLPQEGWMLYALDSPAAMGARGFTRGQLFTQDGKLIASTAQEGLMRWRRNNT